MPIRVIACFLLVLGFSIYAWQRSWFASLCAAVVLMAVMQHPDVAALKSLGGIPGLNPWNFLMINVALAWLCHRRREGLVWDMPRYLRNLLVLYVLVIIWGFLRLFTNNHADLYTTELVRKGGMIGEYFINPAKWILCAFMFYDACRTRQRLFAGLFVVLALYFLLALQVIQHVPLSYAASPEFQHIAYKQIQMSIGYNRVTLSMMLGGASWAILALLHLTPKWKLRFVILGAAGATALAQALTGGRSGYVGWGMVGLILCIVRWRIFLPAVPAAILAVCIFLPGVRDRMLEGFADAPGNAGGATSLHDVTSGRNIAWPYVIAKIKESPVFGYGREGMTTTGIYQKILDETEGEESFPHPHNAYLEVLLDTGLIGFVVIMAFYFCVLRAGFTLFMDKSEPLCGAAGGSACALVLCLLVAAMGGESFFPNEGSIGMWSAIGLMLRAYVEQQRSRLTGLPLFGESDPDHAYVETDDEPAMDMPAPA